MFYYAAIVLSRFLKRAYEEYTLLAVAASKPRGKQVRGRSDNRREL
jgi:hypothetical protein